MPASIALDPRWGIKSFPQQMRMGCPWVAANLGRGGEQRSNFRVEHRFPHDVFVSFMPANLEATCCARCLRRGTRLNTCSCRVAMA